MAKKGYILRFKQDGLKKETFFGDTLDEVAEFVKELANYADTEEDGWECEIVKCIHI